MKLSDLAMVKTGLVLTRKQATKQECFVAEYKQLNLKAINEKGYIDMSLLDTFYANERLKAEYITQPKDIIVRLTAPYTAILIDERTRGLVISSHFIVIRILGESILPEYLYWLLNTEELKSEIIQNMSSTTIGAVKPSLYSEIKIDMISIENQKTIAELNMITKKELRILEELAANKELYYKELIKKFQKEMREN